ncbi:MAG: NitT/TauT family transport system ATP-binding protein [Ascidiaceihabitans sp.]|jgi:NitT/TauT family transport system ATP-binding protein|tara:strand:- start:39 stop:311 length:273 start_codon:yes stop_codon:yes gene_type:complete
MPPLRERAKLDNNTVIDAKNLSLTFETNEGPVHALQDINLQVEKGAFFSFIGPSGCGKTTFLRVMADLEQPTGGEFRVRLHKGTQSPTGI